MLLNSKSNSKWLTRNVFAIGMLSLFSDMGHELTTAILPVFLVSFGGGAIALGAIEGISDAASSLIKLWMSYHSDRIGKRKPILAVGYFVTAMMGTLAFVSAWWQILIIRVIAWIGRGARGPVRDALLSESVPSAAHGRAFGFEGAMDTIGAILGPAIALSLLSILPIRQIFLISFIPGAITIGIVLFGIQETPLTPQPHLRMWSSLKGLSPQFWKYVLSVGVFGLGNFAHTLLVLRAISILTPHWGAVVASQIGIGLYIVHNVIYAAASYPIGALGDRVNKKQLLAVGYAIFGMMCIGFVFANENLALLSILFILSGLYIAIVDAMERALAADLLPLDKRGIGYGALATINSFGDLLSSIIVGLLWTKVSIASGFYYSATTTLIGAAFMLAVSTKPLEKESAI